jgi:hypothetical protein
LTTPADVGLKDVGLYEGDGTMINASARFGKVRREDLNDSYWTRRFVRARRILGATTREPLSVFA